MMLRKVWVANSHNYKHFEKEIKVDLSASSVTMDVSEITQIQMEAPKSTPSSTAEPLKKSKMDEYIQMEWV